ncbi:hypothetical protein ACTXL8_05470 [Glutamicibacter arilaitensis]|uniref:hypothetical protein n=1 Tax=Glutamicibacter arilaitensis TaxID=256701 RepID=UPI003FD08367
MTDQPPLNPDAIHQLFAVAMMGVLDAEKLQPGNRLAHVNDIQEVLNRLEKNVLAVAQPEVNSVEELDALQRGTVIMATGGNWNPEHPELFLKCGYKHAPWMALDPSDRDDGENLESSGAVLRWRCDGEARVLHRPEVGE